MARVFDVTAASDTVHLDSKGEGQIAFTASNVGGRGVRGRAQLVPQDPASKAWLSLVGEAEQDFPVRATRQFAVKVAAPAGSKANKYTFRLDVASVQNPQEDYTQGPTIAFEVKEQRQKQRKPFPWWIPVAAGAAFVIVGGVVLYFVLRGKPPQEAPSQQPSAGRQGSAGPQLPRPTPHGFRVVEVFLRADPFDYTGPCPAQITFSGRISVVGGSGTVSYKFLRSDGASAPVQTVTFDSPGSKGVSTSWTLGGPGLPTYAGWQAIQIFEPQEIASNRAQFNIRCQQSRR